MKTIQAFVKKVLPKQFVTFIKQKRNDRLIKELYAKITELRLQNKKLLFLISTPNHANIGDQAIAVAERKFIREQCSAFSMIEISFNEYAIMKDVLPDIIQKEDMITYHGGGNMGIQYFECEQVFRGLIQTYPENAIIAFPQTVYYGNTEHGIKEFAKSKEIYNLHAHLTLFAREKTSYQIMKKAYPNANVSLVPDIVLYLQETSTNKRHGAMTCLRSDVEKSISEQDIDMIYHSLNQHYSSVRITDTVLDKDYIGKDMSEQVFKEKIEEFTKAEIVITDRLHGMVFSYLTSTPCIAFGNYNYKVLGVYEWIKQNDFLIFIEDIKDLENAILQVTQSTKVKIPVEASLFLPLKQAICDEVQ